jgi:hypothetical protein
MDRIEFELSEAYAVRDLRTARVLDDDRWRALVKRLASAPVAEIDATLARYVNTTTTKD